MGIAKTAFKTAATFVFIVLPGMGFFSSYINDGVREKRTNSILEAAHTACTVPGGDRNLVNNTYRLCMDAVGAAIGNAAPSSLDSRTMLVFSDSLGNAFYASALQSVKTRVPELARVQYQRQELTDKTDGRFTKAIRELTVGGTRPFANADIDVDMQSLIPVVAPDGRETNRYTGKFKVVVTDQNSDARRIFEFDHATGNVSQSMGATSGTVSFHVDLQGYQTYASGTIAGTMNAQNTGPVTCADDKRAACAIVEALHRSLNSLGADEIANLRMEVGAAARYSHATGQPETVKSYMTKAFPAVILKSPGQT